jgi:prepilin-type N-terminal cleavage/methylation domain-containing protein
MAWQRVSFYRIFLVLFGKEDKMKSRKGFTLVELMIVVLILGALAAIAIPRILGGAATARANACATNIDMINSQIELYFANTGEYPPDLPTLTGDTDYFPDGPPVCPVTGLPYPDALTANNRVDASGHAH